MAHFYGTLQGARGEATRLGSKNSGLRTTAASWRGSVRVYLSTENGTDWATVRLEPWHGAGRTVLLYDGPIDGQGAKEFKPRKAVR